MSAAPTPEQAMRFMREAVLHQNIDLTGPWTGWKLRGQYLVAPDKERIPVRELIGLVIHYRAKFRHKPTKQPVAAPKADNVISFTQAATERLTHRRDAA